MLFTRIRDILKDTSIYGASKVLGQLISFFLIPVYTTYLTPDDYGVLSLIGITSTSIALLMTFGVDSATYRYVGLAKDEDAQRKYVANAQIITFSVILIISVIVLVFIHPLNQFIVSSESPLIYLFLGLGMAIFSTVTSIPRAYLRIRRKVMVIAGASLINVTTSILLTILFVVILKYGVIGALLGNLFGALLTSIFIMIKVPLFSLSLFESKTCRKLLAYSLPTLPSHVFAFAIPLYSQWSVKELLSLQELGLYAVGLKFTIPVSAALTMFQQAYSPYKFEILKSDKEPKRTFSRLFTLIVLGFTALFLMISFFGGDVLKLMTKSNFHGASEYVFYIALIPLAQLYYFMMGTGVEFAKSPIYRPFVSGAALLTVVLTNSFLIRKLGIAGAALSITAGWIVMAIATYIYAQSLYRIKYKWGIVLLFLAFTITVSYFLNGVGNDFLAWKIVISLIILAGISYLAIFKYRVVNLLWRRNEA